MLNRELVGQQAIRMGSREALLTSLKTINLAIEQFSRLRGNPLSDRHNLLVYARQIDNLSWCAC